MTRTKDRSGLLTAAVYYPHTRIRSQALLKTALLLWDQVEVIVPAGRRLPQPKQTRELHEATELLVRSRPPSDDEKTAVHRRLEVLLGNGLPDWLRCSVADGWRGARAYMIYPEKLAHETWRLLRDADALDFNEATRDYSVPPALGLLMMAILADEFAGITKRRLTDRDAAYRWLTGIMTEEMGGQYLPNMDPSHLANTYERLTTISLEVVDGSSLPVRRLIEMRRREQKERSRDLAKLRRKYLSDLDKHVHQLASGTLSVRDRAELERQFRIELESDLAELKEALGYSKRKVLLSTTLWASILASAGSAVAALSGTNALVGAVPGGGIGALLELGTTFRHDRRKVLNEHTMSWLYLARHPRQ